MEIVLTRNLKEGDILAADLMDAYDTILLKKGIELSKGHILAIKSAGIYYVIVKSKNKVSSDSIKKLNAIKETMINVIPGFFDAIFGEDSSKIEEELYIVDDMVKYIVETGEINTSIFDLKEYDDYTYVHCVNTSIMATFLGIQLNLKPEELSSLALGAILHDIGKMKLSINILNKKEKLTIDEFNEIKNHTLNGELLLRNAGIKDKIVLDIVLQHHERIDGNGYPYGISGDEISIFAKIVSICDVFTALSANRSYRDRFNPNDAYEFILTKYNIMFDSYMVNTFKETFAIYPRGCKIRLSNGIEGSIISQNKGFPDRPIIKVYYDGGLKRAVKNYDLNLLDYINLTIVETLK
ncbi:MAG: HD-GYP domain-containing protein [Clostridiaceae bacterium]|nr:HD-GYP domain-containing protein [Clostridiaceae bacterium]